MKRFLTLSVLIFTLLTLCAFTGCPQPQNTARDGIAAAQGFIEDQQAQRLTECKAEPTKPVCLAINKAVAAQNLAIDALEVYCASPEFATGKGECVPNRQLEPKLTEALRNLNDAIAQVKTLK